LDPIGRAIGSILFYFALIFVGCANFQGPSFSGPPRTFVSSFESEEDFSLFYIESRPEFASGQVLATDIVRDGIRSHKAWILSARHQDNDGLVYEPHRAYPTIQLQKTEGGTFRTPCLASLWVYLDMELRDRAPGIDDWFSFATLSPDPSDAWARTVCVNIVHEGYVHLMHVPRQGKGEYLFQASSDNDPDGALSFPFRRWVRLDIFIDFDRKAGYAKVWQDGSLVSHAMVEGGEGGLAQAHFGLYASAALPSGVIYNDKLRIAEVQDEAEALGLVRAPW
jgi:hypothetical protein